MNKIIITLETEADIMAINVWMQQVLGSIKNNDLALAEYTIQKAR